MRPTHPRLLRITVAGVLAAVLAAVAFVAGPVASASAAAPTATYLSMHPTVSSPIAGQQVTLQVYSGSLAGNFPAGDIEVMVEGSGMKSGQPASQSAAADAFTIGNFPIGTITVDATFTPTDSATYAPTTLKASFAIVGASLTIRPLIATTPALGHSTLASTLIALGSGTPHAPGGTVSFVVLGKAVAMCTPQPTGLVANWSCKATLPAPAASGAYTVTASFSGSAYYVPSSGSQTYTVAAAPKPVTKAPAPVVVASTPTPTATPREQPDPTASAQPVAAATTADARTSVAGPAGPWPWLFLAALALLIAAVVAVVLLLRRRSTAG